MMEQPATIFPVQTPTGSYEIHIQSGLLQRVGERLKALGLIRGKVVVVTNPTVAQHHLGPLLESLRSFQCEPVVCEVPDGEVYKTLETVSSLYGRFLEAGLDRGSVVLSLGGGVVGDIAGFAAATYLRGISFVQIPTSLLAMVDASIGGKTGVDLPQGKNLVGAFKQPEAVLIDPSVLSTLDPRELRSGMAEVIKHAIIDDPALFERIAREPNPSDWGEVIKAATLVKARIVEEDPLERGCRALLNLGHTFGHAFEVLSGFELRHGYAVGLGMIAAARMGARMGKTPEGLEGEIRGLLRRVGLPIHWEPVDSHEVVHAMRFDKKRKGKTLYFIIPTAIGAACIVEDPGVEIIRDAIGALFP